MTAGLQSGEKHPSALRRLLSGENRRSDGCWLLSGENRRSDEHMRLYPRIHKHG